MSIIRLDSNFMKTTGILRVSEFVRRMYLATMAVSALDFIWENLVTISFETVWTFRSFYLWIIKSVCSATGVEMFSQSISSCLQCMAWSNFPPHWLISGAGRISPSESQQAAWYPGSLALSQGWTMNRNVWLDVACCLLFWWVCEHLLPYGGWWSLLAESCWWTPAAQWGLSLSPRENIDSTPCHLLLADSSRLGLLISGVPCCVVCGVWWSSDN